MAESLAHTTSSRCPARLRRRHFPKRIAPDSDAADLNRNRRRDRRGSRTAAEYWPRARFHLVGDARRDNHDLTTSGYPGNVGLSTISEEIV
jgi:hypothetical protein